MNPTSPIDDNGPKQPILLVGPRVGATVTGVAVAFDMLVDHLPKQNIKVGIVNLTQESTTKRAGRVTVARTVFTVAKIIEAWWKLLWYPKVYMTISSSKAGFARDYLIIFFAWLMGRQIFLHLHGGGYKHFYETCSDKMQRRIRWILLKADRIIVLGELLKEQFSFLDSPSKLRVVPNGLPSEKPNLKLHVKNAPTDNRWQILYLSNLMESKGYYMLLNSAELLLNQGIRNFEIHFCGDFVTSIVEEKSHHAIEFRRRLKNSPLNEHVYYHGTVSGTEKESALANCHYLVLPTLYPWEGQPLSIIEALANGTPVISTVHAGIPEQVIDGENGWLLKSSDLNDESLANCLKEAMQISTEDYQEMSRNACETYRTKFTAAKHLQRLTSVLTESKLDREIV